MQEEDREQYAEEDPRRHTIRIKGMLTDTISHLREDVSKVDDPRAEALFETTAEVLQGLVTAYEHYEQGAEEAWRPDPSATTDVPPRAGDVSSDFPRWQDEGGR